MVTFGLTYDLSSKKVQFLSTANWIQYHLLRATSFPLTDGFSLGPMDDSQAISNIGKIDDFRIYGISLSSEEISKLYGTGNGDFNKRVFNSLILKNWNCPKLSMFIFLMMEYQLL